MKIIFTILLLLEITIHAGAQNTTDSIPVPVMNATQLEAYRQYIWDSVPAAVGWVNDYGLLFEKEQEDLLERTFAKFEKETSIEIMVVTIDSFMIDKIQFDEFSYRLLRLWGIGKINKSNGMVICISRDYKKVHISSDFGIDKFMNKYEQQKIINKYFIPWYTQDRFYTGTFEGIKAIQEKINKTWKKYN